MNRFFVRLVVAIAVVATLHGCASVEVGVKKDACGAITGTVELRVFGDGQKIQQCIVNGQAVGVQGYPVYRPQPFEQLEHIFDSGDGMMQRLTQGGQSPEFIRGGVGGHESNGRASYMGDFDRRAETVRWKGQVLPPPRRHEDGSRRGGYVPR